MLCLIVLWLERRNFSWVDYGSRKILSLSGYTRSTIGGRPAFQVRNRSWEASNAYINARVLKESRQRRQARRSHP